MKRLHKPKKSSDRNSRLRFSRVERLEDRRLLAVDGFEQEFIYSLNRARHDPAAYQAERNLSVSLANVTPRPPLAVNALLSNSADVKARDLTANNYFAHVSPAGVHANQLARNANYALPDFYPDANNFIESLAAGTDMDNAASPLEMLIVDAADPNLGHRKQLLGIDDFNAANREIGVGFDSSANTSFTNYWAIHAARQQDVKSYLTGVVYDDTDGDGRYDAGEGLGGVTITVDAATTTRTNAAGGWSVEVADGPHWVVVRGGQFNGVGAASATVAGNNVEIDFISGKASSQVAFTERYGQYVVDPPDVNVDGTPTAGDALLIINHVGRATNGGESVFNDRVFLDVSGDGAVSSIDALQVINAVAQRATASGEQFDRLAVVEAKTRDQVILELVSDMESSEQKLALVSARDQAASESDYGTEAAARSVLEAAIEIQPELGLSLDESSFAWSRD